MDKFKDWLHDFWIDVQEWFAQDKRRGELSLYLFLGLLFLLFAVSAHAEDKKRCSTVDEVTYEHISAVRDGIPFNTRPETQSDMVFLRLFDCRSGRFFARGALGVNVGSSELEGRDPFGRFVIGIKLKK